MAHSKKQEECGSPPGHWESLCPDVRRVVLSKVPLQDLALAAGTCREFRGAFCERLGEERERLISLAEASYGKDVVSGFVKSVQDGICCLDPYYNQMMKAKEDLVIDAAGNPKLVTFDTVMTLLREGCVATFARHYHAFYGVHWLVTGCRHSCGDVMIKVLRMCSGTFRTHIEASISCEGQMGIFLAICTRDHEPKLPRARRFSESPKTVPAVIGGPGITKEFRGPLGVLADTFFLYTL